MQRCTFSVKDNAWAGPAAALWLDQRYLLQCVYSLPLQVSSCPHILVEYINAVAFLLIPPQMFQITPVYFIASLLFLVWVLLTCLKRISCFWISHVTLTKVLYSSESTEHLLCCRLAVFRWQHYKSLAATFDLIEWANLSKDAKVYNWEFSLQVLAYADHLQAIKYTEINPTLHQMMHF